MQRLWQILAIGLTLATLASCGGRGLTTPPPTGGGGAPGNGSLTQVNHIVWMLQENRSFDTYFGSLNAYRSAHGLGSNDVDGLPAGASNPSWDGTSTVAAYHLNTVCFENVTPSWDASRRAVDVSDPSDPSSPMDGFVYAAAHFAQDENAKGIFYADIDGLRAMGYYTDADLPYYYFMATQFATSDRFFSPILSRTPPNRIANLAGSALGVVNGIPPSPNYTHDTIFSLAQNAGISWKVYTTGTTTYLEYFAPFYAKYKSTNVFPISQYFTDLKNGTLPQIAFIETGVEVTDEGGTSELDEHPDANIQKGAAYVSGIINALMSSSSWKDSAFILTYDEGGGLYDHVAPITAAVPDGTPPALQPGNQPDTYSRTGFRVPMIVVSPFTKPGFVSHLPMDTTAILKLIETRFNLGSLSARDAAQPDMSKEFFDLTNIPNLTPPSASAIPVQPTTGTCTVHSITP